MNKDTLSVVIPAKNEAQTIGDVVSSIHRVLPSAEIIVVDDGSDDSTSLIASRHGAKVISHLYSKGNGAAIKTGARNATGEHILFMDGDGQHRPEDAALLVNKMREGYDMVVGARTREGQASGPRALANFIYNRISSWVTGHEIRDLTSGMRIVDAAKFKEFLYLLPNGFSYPTTSTMAFFRAGYNVGYEDITVNKRLGNGHINIIRDGVRFLLIIFKVGTLYSPLKIFFPVSVGFFTSGSLYYLFTYISEGRFTNMAALLIIASIMTFMMGLMSEQLTTLLYKDRS